MSSGAEEDGQESTSSTAGAKNPDNPPRARFRNKSVDSHRELTYSFTSIVWKARE